MKQIVIYRMTVNSIKFLGNKIKVGGNKIDRTQKLIVAKYQAIVAKSKNDFLTKFKIKLLNKSQYHVLPIQFNYKTNKSEFLTSKTKLVFIQFK